MTGLGFSRHRKTGLVIAGERRDVALKAFSGPPIYEREALGPWKGSVRVERWGTRTGQTFRVVAEWFGPPIAGAQPSPIPIHAIDLIEIDDGERAVRVARAAADLLAATERPDLDLLSRRFVG